MKIIKKKRRRIFEGENNKTKMQVKGWKWQKLNKNTTSSMEMTKKMQFRT